MSLFEFEDRTCPNCGDAFQALGIWPSDSVCGPCNRARYQARLDAINATRSFKVENIGGACPTQAEGRTSEDRPFYFRARHGEWALHLGLTGWPTCYVDWPDDKYDDGFVIAEGDDPSDGFMSDDEVLAVLDQHLATEAAS